MADLYYCLLRGRFLHREISMKLPNVNRVEVIDHTKSVDAGGGRAYTFWKDGVSVEFELQDDGRTLKIFITEGHE
jgi:hypothetical protein